jgi:hypothetical protein
MSSKVVLFFNNKELRTHFHYSYIFVVLETEVHGTFFPLHYCLLFFLLQVNTNFHMLYLSNDLPDNLQKLHYKICYFQ